MEGSSIHGSATQAMIDFDFITGESPTYHLHALHGSLSLSDIQVIMNCLASSSKRKPLLVTIIRDPVEYAIANRDRKKNMILSPSTICRTFLSSWIYFSKSLGVKHPLEDLIAAMANGHHGWPLASCFHVMHSADMGYGSPLEWEDDPGTL